MPIDLLRLFELYEYMEECVDALLPFLVFSRVTLQVELLACEFEPVLLHFVFVVHFSVDPSLERSFVLLVNAKVALGSSMQAKSPTANAHRPR